MDRCVVEGWLLMVEEWAVGGVLGVVAYGWLFGFSMNFGFVFV